MEPRKELGTSKTRDIGIGMECDSEKSIRKGIVGDVSGQLRRSTLKQFSTEKFFASSSVTSPLTRKSLFYDGKTVFGGLSTRRAERLASASPYCLGSSKMQPIIRVKVNETKQLQNDNLSAAAKRIYEKIERVSTPLEDVKRMPIYYNRRNAQSHKRTIAMRSSEDKTIAPPIASILVPAMVSIDRNAKRIKWDMSIPKSSDNTIVTPEPRVAFDYKQDSDGGGKMRTVIAKKSQRTDTVTDNNDNIIDNFAGIEKRGLDFHGIEFPKINLSQKTPQELCQSKAVPSHPTTTITKVFEDDENEFKFSSPILLKRDDNKPFKFSTVKPQNSKYVNSQFPLTNSTLSIHTSVPKVSASNNETIVKPAIELKHNVSVMDVLKRKSPEKGTVKPLMRDISKPKDTVNVNESFGSLTDKKETNSGVSAPLTDMFRPSLGEWRCAECYVMNKPDKLKCVCCSVLNPKAKNEEINEMKTPVEKKNELKSEWKCSECGKIKNISDTVCCDKKRFSSDIITPLPKDYYSGYDFSKLSGTKSTASKLDISKDKESDAKNETETNAGPLTGFGTNSPSYFAKAANNILFDGKFPIPSTNFKPSDGFKFGIPMQSKSSENMTSTVTTTLTVTTSPSNAVNFDKSVSSNSNGGINANLFSFGVPSTSSVSSITSSPSLTKFPMKLPDNKSDILSNETKLKMPFQSQSIVATESAETTQTKSVDAPKSDGFGLVSKVTAATTAVTAITQSSNSLFTFGGASGIGTSGIGTSGIGTSGIGTSGIGTSRIGTSGIGTSGVGTSGIGTSGIGTSPSFKAAIPITTATDQIKNSVSAVAAANTTVGTGVLTTVVTTTNSFLGSSLPKPFTFPNMSKSQLNTKVPAVSQSTANFSFTPVVTTPIISTFSPSVNASSSSSINTNANFSNAPSSTNSIETGFGNTFPNNSIVTNNSNVFGSSSAPKNDQTKNFTFGSLAPSNVSAPSNTTNTPNVGYNFTGFTPNNQPSAATSGYSSQTKPSFPSGFTFGNQTPQQFGASTASSSFPQNTNSTFAFGGTNQTVPLFGGSLSQPTQSTQQTQPFNFTGAAPNPFAFGTQPQQPQQQQQQQTQPSVPQFNLNPPQTNFTNTTAPQSSIFQFSAEPTTVIHSNISHSSTTNRPIRKAKRRL